MGWFWNRQASTGERLAALEADLEATRKELRTLRAEVVETSERVYRWMKKAQAAARRATDDDAPNQDRPPAEPPAAPSPSPSRRGLFGARGRIAARGYRSDPMLDLSLNGADSEGS